MRRRHLRIGAARGIDPLTVGQAARVCLAGRSVYRPIMAPSNDGRDQAGRFMAGTTPNPTGKPRGTRNRATALLDRMAEKGAGEVLKAVLIAAQGGDVSAATLLLSRVWPARRGRAIVFDLPDLTAPGGAAAALAALAQQTAAVDYPRRKAPPRRALIVELHQGDRTRPKLIRRIERLEAHHGLGSPAVPSDTDHATGGRSGNGRDVTAG